MADAGCCGLALAQQHARVYLNYDARFRAALQSHQGTLGIEFKWCGEGAGQ